MKAARFTMRIHPLIMQKLKVIAANNGRSANREIEQILKWVVDDYERRYGKIKREEIEQIERAKESLDDETQDAARQDYSSSLFKMSVPEKK